MTLGCPWDDEVISALFIDIFLTGEHDGNEANLCDQTVMGLGYQRPILGRLFDLTQSREPVKGLHLS